MLVCGFEKGALPRKAAHLYCHVKLTFFLTIYMFGSPKPKRTENENLKQNDASFLKQDPNTKMLKRTLIYLNTDTLSKFSGKSPLPSPKRHLNTDKRLKTIKNEIKRKQDKSFSFIFDRF